jgi:hypothetical protein
VIAVKRFGSTFLVLVFVGLAGGMAALANECFYSPGHTGDNQYPPKNHSPYCFLLHASRSVLTPANGDMVTVTFSGIFDLDPGDTVTTTILGVTSSESGGAWTIGPGNQVTLKAVSGANGRTRTYTITVQGADTKGGTCAGTVTVTVAPNHRPNCTHAYGGGSLTNPDHKMKSFTIGGIEDEDHDPVKTTITSIKSTEPISGLGKGDVSPDWSSSSSSTTYSVRDERYSKTRRYTVHAHGDDGHGGTCDCDLYVDVN